MFRIQFVIRNFSEVLKHVTDQSDILSFWVLKEIWKLIYLLSLTHVNSKTIVPLSDICRKGFIKTLMMMMMMMVMMMMMTSNFM